MQLQLHQTEHALSDSAMVFFDIDDTLTDSITAHQRSIVALAERHGLPLRDAEIAQRQWMEITDRHLDRFFKKEVSAQEQRIERLVEFWTRKGGRLSAEQASGLYPEYHQLFLHHCRLFPDVASALDRLDGLELGIISNGVSSDQHRKLVHNGVAARFSPIVISEDVGYAKPAAGIFEVALRLTGKSPSACCYIGNSYELDYLGAKAAGWQSIWIDRHHEDHPVPPGHRCTSFAAAVDLVLADKR